MKNNNRGIAIITAIMALAFLVYLATQVTYDATVEYAINSQDVKRLKAYYAARAGLDMSLVRIKTYQQVASKLGKNLPSFPMVNMIWQYPIQWPLALPDTNLSLTDKQNIQESGEESFFDASFTTQISDEGSKLDLNDLVSPSKVLREGVRRQLLNTFTQQMENDEKFANKYRNFRFEELINQITDFMSDKRTSLNGGDKAGAYSRSDYQGYPPNRGFRTVGELRILPLMDEQLFQLLENRVTTFGLKGINPNTATKEVLMSLDPAITSEIADKLIARRQNENEGGPFKSADEFWSAVQSLGARITVDPKEVPIITETLTSFRVKSIGVYSNVRSTIEVVVVDVDQIAYRVANKVFEENPPTPPPVQPGQPAPPAPVAPPAPKIAPGMPRILYWTEY
ncbi:MAG: general secretion pathway protein GspK [Bdellovibrionales bacterium]